MLLQIRQSGDSADERSLPPAQLVIRDSAAVCHGGGSWADRRTGEPHATL